MAKMYEPRPQPEPVAVVAPADLERLKADLESRIDKLEEKSRYTGLTADAAQTLADARAGVAWLHATIDRQHQAAQPPPPEPPPPGFAARPWDVLTKLPRPTGIELEMARRVSAPKMLGLGVPKK